MAQLANSTAILPWRTVAWRQGGEGSWTRLTKAAGRFALAAGLTLAALLVRLALAPHLEQQLPYATFYAAVALAAVLAGPAPTLVAIVSGYLAGVSLFGEPGHSLVPRTVAAWTGATTYLAVCGIILGVSTSLSRARKRADAARRQLERELAQRQRAEGALRHSEQTLRLAKEAARMGAWSWDLGTGALTWSERCKALFGLAPDAAITYDRFLAALHPDDRERVHRAVKESLAAGTPYEVDMRVPLPDGSIRWLSARGEASCGADGRPSRMAGMVLDVTERKAAEEALRDADRHKDEFLSMLSHELRNPLAPLRNAVHVLGRVDPSGDQAERARTIVARQVDHLARLVDDLLDVRRISTGKLRLHRSPIDLRAQVSETVEDVRPVFANRSVSLELSLPDDPVWVNGDRTRIAQVVSNLLHNAAKFTDAGGRVSVAVESGAGQSRIRVRDDGVGIAPEMIEQVFQPFVQSDRTLHRTRGGLGLGLALVRGIAQLHGGGVTVESAGVGKGSEFVVTLPTAGEASAPPLEASAPPAGARCRVLVVEDNADAAASLRDVLEVMGGHEVHVASDGEAGLAAARQLAPDVILCDVGLPVLDGYEVARRIRASGAAPGARLVALSGYASAEDVDRALRAGFDYHLAKPADVDGVLRLVADAPRCGRCASVPGEIATGHHEVDAQHAAILAELERLRRATPDAVWASLAFLQQHTASHFGYEEDLMEDVGFPDVELHRRRHEEFLVRMRALAEGVERDGATPESLGRLADTVTAWVKEHVLEEDRLLAEHIGSRRSAAPAGAREGAPA